MAARARQASRSREQPLGEEHPTQGYLLGGQEILVGNLHVGIKPPRSLQAHLGSQKLELIMRRIELGTSQLALLEDDLRDALSSRTSLDREAMQMKMILDQVDNRIEDDPAGGTPEDQRIKEDLEIQLKLLEDRKWNLEQRILDYEQDLKEGRERVSAWEELVDTRLDLR